MYIGVVVIYYLVLLKEVTQYYTFIRSETDTLVLKEKVIHF